jgi:hypothetical protein
MLYPSYENSWKDGNMARRKGNIIADQGAKIKAISLSRGLIKNIHWEIELDIKPSTLSNWRTGRAISIENLEKISRFAGISPEDFNLPLSEFCKKLGVPDISGKLAQKQDYPYFAHEKLAPNDQDILGSLPGRYRGFYISWQEGQEEHTFIKPEIFEIYHQAADQSHYLFEQRNNVTQNEPVFGRIGVTNERVFGFITYRTYYPPTSYLLIAYPSPVKQPTLYGVCTDISPMPEKVIYSLPFLLLPEIEGISDLDEKILQNTELFATFQELLTDENVLSFNKRLLIRATIDIRNKIKNMWKNLGAPVDTIF